MTWIKIQTGVLVRLDSYRKVWRDQHELYLLPQSAAPDGRPEVFTFADDRAAERCMSRIGKALCLTL